MFDLLWLENFDFQTFCLNKKQIDADIKERDRKPIYTRVFQDYFFKNDWNKKFSAIIFVMK